MTDCNVVLREILTPAYKRSIRNVQCSSSELPYSTNTLSNL